MIFWLFSITSGVLFAHAYGAARGWWSAEIISTQYEFALAGLIWLTGIVYVLLFDFTRGKKK